MEQSKCRCECKELIRVVVIKDLSGTLVTVIVNAINHMILENIQIIKILNVEKG